MIPFKLSEGMEVFTKVKVDNSKIFIYDTPLYIKKGDIELNGNILTGDINILKTFKGDENLTYKGDIKGEVDFSNKISKGGFLLNSGSYYGVESNNTKGNFNIDFKKGFKAGLFFDNNSTVKIYTESFVLDNSDVSYTYGSGRFISKIEARHEKFPLGFALDGYLLYR